MITLDLYQTLAVAVVALWVGNMLRRYIPVLAHFCIPSPVIGGLLFAFLSLAGYLSGWFVCAFDDTMKQVCMVFFFTSVGFQANLKTVRQGGKPLAVLVGLVAFTVIIQNLVAIGIANFMGLSSLIGMTAGSIPMVGGHGTAGAFGPLLEDMGVTGATTLATAAATFGLVAGSLIGGPIGERLIEKHHLLSTGSGDVEEIVMEAHAEHHDSAYTTAVFQMIVAVGIGTLVSYALSLTGMTFPIYIGGMIVAAVMRNYSEYSHKLSIPMAQISDMGGICLSLFLGIAMVTLRLWELAELALPLVAMLSVQLLIMIFFAYFVVFRVMGRDYDAAVLTAGFCGFGMGATPNAMANMQAICDKYRPSVKAYLLIPIVGSMFTDFVNSLLITFFINFV
ncbi:MAG: sodium/glutamate symporter [Bacteroidaceae bacterium]|nr:sodium/glutamate symporter [Bacteroidaceae bacterium]